jgi:hypothetical protein
LNAQALSLAVQVLLRTEITDAADQAVAVVRAVAFQTEVTADAAAVLTDDAVADEVDGL